MSEFSPYNPDSQRTGGSMGGGWSNNKKPYESPRPSVEPPKPYKPETIYSGEIGRSSGYGESGRGNEAPVPKPSGESGRSWGGESGRAPVVEKPTSGESGRTPGGESGRAPVVERPTSGESGRSIGGESGRSSIIEKPTSGESGRSIGGESGRASVIEKPTSSEGGRSTGYGESGRKYEAPTPGDIARRNAENHYEPPKPSTTPTSSGEGGRGYSRGG